MGDKYVYVLIEDSGREQCVPVVFESLDVAKKVGIQTVKDYDDRWQPMVSKVNKTTWHIALSNDVDESPSVRIFKQPIVRT